MGKCNSLNLLDHSKKPEKIEETCERENDETTILVEDTLSGALNLSCNDLVKNAVSPYGSHLEVRLRRINT